MPRPVLSETTFNSDNVATSILQQANLQITNENLGVTNRSSVFTKHNDFGDNAHSVIAYSFNGFMFLNFNVYRVGTMSTQMVVYTINDSDFYPITRTTAPAVGYEGDLVSEVRAETAGNIKIFNPSNQSSAGFYISCQMFYRYQS
mgnify:CR=1 FL=1